MTRKKAATPEVTPTPTEAELAAADAVRAARQAERTAKAAALKALAIARKTGKGHHADGRKNVGLAASSSKATAVSRSIISRARGGRGR